MRALTSQVVQLWRLQPWRRYGQSVLMLVLWASFVSFFIAHNRPYEAEYWFELTGAEKQAEIEALITAWADSTGVELLSCPEVRPANEAGQVTVACVYRARDLEIWFDALDLLADSLRDIRVHSDCAVIGASGFVTSSSLRSPPLWVLIVLTGLAPLVALCLLHDNDWQQDFSRLRFAVRRQPWVLLLPIAVWVLATSVSTLLLALAGLDFERLAALAVPEDLPAEHALTLGLTLLMIPWVMLSSLLLAPIVEEAVFRGWLHKETQTVEPRWLTGIANAWFFMLMHLAVMIPGLMLGFQANPAQASPMAMPVWFGLGLLLFWVRERFGSVLLCMLLHIVHNATTLLAMAWALSALGGLASA